MESKIDNSIAYNLTFHHENEKIGELEWNDGVLNFTGKANESAKILFDFLKPLIDDYIKGKINNGR